MNTRKRIAQKANASKVLGISSMFRDENNQLKMIFDKEDGTQTIRGNNKIEGLQNFKFKPGTIKSPSRELQASIYASTHNYSSYSKSDGPGDTDSITSDILFATSENFENFARKNFQLKDSKPECYLKKPLTDSLLPSKDKNGHLFLQRETPEQRQQIIAAISSWFTILKIMGDIADHNLPPENSKSQPTTFLFIKENLAKKFTKKDVDEAVKTYQKLTIDPETECKDIPFMFPARHILDHIQFLCCLGILKNSLRDEIYCQVLKQLTQNPSQSSSSRGWLLLFLMVGVFHPTETMMPCLLTFLRESQVDVAPKIEYSLRRSLRNGTRNYPPGWTEFHAMKNYKPIFLPVILMTGDRILTRVDSSTTVKEMCKSISRNMDLQESTGFSLFASLFDKISYLGDSNHRIMDTICECEYLSKISSVSESNSPWRLYFRKEYFPPWEIFIKDPVAVNLIYAQVMRGIAVEEYSFEDSQLIYFTALKYYVTNEELLINKLTKLVEKFLPKRYIRSRSVNEWVNLVAEKFKQEFQKNKKTVISCQNEVIDFAMKKLHKSFCRLFEIKQFTSPNNKFPNVVCAVHQKGLTLVDGEEQERLHLKYEEIIIVKKKGNWVHIRDVRGVNNMMETHQVEEMVELLNSFLEKISNNSRVALAIDACNVPEKQNFSASLHILNGDIIVLEKPFKVFKDSEYIDGMCQRTQRAGQFSKDIIHPLAFVDIPNSTHLNALASQVKNTEWSQESVGRYTHYSLDEYAKEHLQPIETGMTKMLSIKRGAFHEPWTHSKEPIKHPLSKKIQQRADLKYCACNIFYAILTYMEDIKRTEVISDIILATDKIFEIAIRNRYLRNEIYVQLMKQLTDNEDVTSRNKGWVLMWLLTGCVVPQEDMYQEVLKFLQASESSLAEECFNRIKILRLTGSRVYPPHTLEHLAVSSHCVDPIKLDIILSDASVVKMKVYSYSMVMDVCDKIVSKLGLTSSFGYSLFVKTKNRVIPLADNDYIMDILGHLEVYYITQPLQVKDKSFKFQFMKKLWTLDDMKEDFVADAMFNYHQDIPSYIAGFHDCSVETAVKLSALIYKATHDNVELDTKMFREVVIPEKFILCKKKEDWMKEIYCELQSIKTLTKKEAKVAYVNITKGFRTYGSVFFEIKMSDKPQALQLAVNKNEILIMDPKTKEIFYAINYQQLRNWTHENGKITMTAEKENTDGRHKIFFEIDKFQGELLDDLIMANIEFSLNSRLKNFQLFSGGKRGETVC